MKCCLTAPRSREVDINNRREHVSCIDASVSRPTSLYVSVISYLNQAQPAQGPDIGKEVVVIKSLELIWFEWPGILTLK